MLAIGGFNGTDPAPTLAEFEALVAAGRIHFYLGGAQTGRGGGAGGSSASTIASRVEQHFTAATIGGVTVYDLAPGSS